MKLSTAISVVLSCLPSCSQRSDSIHADMSNQLPNNLTLKKMQACERGDALGVSAVVELGRFGQSGGLDRLTDVGVSPLFAAAVNKHVHIVDYLLLNGASLKIFLLKAAEDKVLMKILPILLEKSKFNTQNPNPNRASCAYNDHDVSARAKASVSDLRHGLFKSVDLFGTAYQIALENGNLDAVQMLLHRGADPNEPVHGLGLGLGSMGDDDGNTPLHLATGSLELIQLLIKHGAVIPTDPISSAQLLCNSLKKGDLGVVKFFLENGADPTGWGMQTPPLIEIAIASSSRERLELVTLLIEHGVSPTDFMLSVAAETGALDVAQLLVVDHGADPNEVNAFHTTPLYVAIECGHEDLVRFLLEKNADPNQTCCVDGETHITPLLLAAQSEKEGAEMMVVTLLGSNAQPDLAIEGGFTALYSAARRGSSLMTTALINAGTTSANIAYEDDGCTPLLKAIIEKHWPVAQILLNADNTCMTDYPDDPGDAVAEQQQDVLRALRSAHAAPAGVEFILSLTNASSAVYGADLRGKQLWLWSNLMAVVALGRDPNANRLQITASRFSLLESLRADFGIVESNGNIMPGTVSRHLDVTFVGEDSSGDGLRRELLQMATSELSNLQSGLFVSRDGGRTIQPNPESKVTMGSEHLSYFTLLGCITGCALYHRETIPAAQWTIAFVKTAFDYPIVPEDVQSVDPEYYQQKIAYLQESIYASRDGMKLEDLALTFETEHQFEEYSAKTKKLETVKLKEDGADIAVTEENKDEYIHLCVKHRLVGAIKEQVDAFKRGLGVFFPPQLLVRLRQELSAADLKLLVCGAPEIDVDDWQASAGYMGGFSADSEQVKWFWDIVRNMDREQRIKLLDFCTGSAQAPATGFANLVGYSGDQHRFTLQNNNLNEHRLPTVSTCFNTLSMPMYASAKVLEEKLLAAIDNAEGFDENAVAT